jgi:outer membrane immunogenic protein
MAIREPHVGVMRALRLRLGAVVIGALGICGSALAADMPLKAPAAAPLIPAPPSWTGCYIGGNLGGGWALKDWTNPRGDLDVSGGTAALGSFVGGGQIGCDYQFALPWVIGLEGMFNGADLSATVTDTVNPDFQFSSRVNWFGTLTARLGYTLMPTGLLYVKGGVAWTRDRHSVLDQSSGAVASAENTRSGWTAGVGFEYMFLPNWSAFVEYDYMGFGTSTLPFTASDGSFHETWDIRQNVQAVLVGLNFRFNFGKAPAEPVVAKY